MTVKLNIQDDTELRNYVKEMIKNQVMNIVREEFMTMVKEELERKLKGVEKQNFNFMLKEALTKAVREELSKIVNITPWSTTFLQPYVDNVMNEAVKNKDWNKLVDDLAKEKVKALIK